MPDIKTLPLLHPLPARPLPHNPPPTPNKNNPRLVVNRGLINPIVTA